jgi:hypothetical protein
MGTTRSNAEFQLAKRVRLSSRAELADFAHWKYAFADCRKDHRYYELVEDTLRHDFEYWYLTVAGAQGEVQAIQPCFIVDQDLVAGVGPKIKSLIAIARRASPRFLKIRTLMVGCTAGEGRLDGSESSFAVTASALAAALVSHARKLRASLIVLKEFPAKYREPLKSFLENGFCRVPSLPMTRLALEYESFDDYMNRALNSATRRKLRKKFRAAAQAAPIEMSITDDVTTIVDEIYPLYLQVYTRSKLHFEKLTREYFCQLGRSMPDRVRFFIWRQNSKIVAFILCMLEGDALYAEYIGLDYSVALQLHLYHYAVRDLTSWAIANRFKSIRSSGLNYDPKLHLRHSLDPTDLYVRHISPVANRVLKAVLPLIEPTRNDPILKKFPNYADLWERS